MIGPKDEIPGLTNHMIMSALAISLVGIGTLLQRKGIASIGEMADSLKYLAEEFPDDAGSFIVKECANAMRAPVPIGNGPVRPVLQVFEGGAGKTND